MRRITTGGPAFPTDNGMEGGMWSGSSGMTLRDYFAAKAMLGIIADPHHDTGDMGGYDNIANFAYNIADAMLKAREASHG